QSLEPQQMQRLPSRTTSRQKHRKLLTAKHWLSKMAVSLCHATLPPARPLSVHFCAASLLQGHHIDLRSQVLGKVECVPFVKE
ncbi:hypothetical protein HispidOSU_029196, partial [Sigmodon hispidus]